MLKKKNRLSIAPQLGFQAEFVREIVFGPDFKLNSTLIIRLFINPLAIINCSPVKNKNAVRGARQYQLLIYRRTFFFFFF